MNKHLIRVGIPSAIAGVVILAALTGCAKDAAQPAPLGASATADPTATGGTGSPVLGTTPATTPAGGGAGAGGGGGGAGGGGGGTEQWPSPEDCVDYDPGTAQVSPNNAGGLSVWASGRELLRFYEGGDENAPAKVLALVKRYRTVCFVGRGSDRLEFTFEYWKNPSGNNSPIPDSEDDCRSYDRNNLQVDDTGDGWRVKNDDNPLQLFRSQQEADSGRIVLAKYDRLCEIQTESFDDGEDRASITYA